MVRPRGEKDRIRCMEDGIQWTPKDGKYLITWRMITRCADITFQAEKKPKNKKNVIT